MPLAQMTEKLDEFTIVSQFQCMQWIALTQTAIDKIALRPNFARGMLGILVFTAALWTAENLLANNTFDLFVDCFFFVFIYLLFQRWGGVKGKKNKEISPEYLFVFCLSKSNWIKYLKGQYLHLVELESFFSLHCGAGWTETVEHTANWFGGVFDKPLTLLLVYFVFHVLFFFFRFCFRWLNV